MYDADSDYPFNRLHILADALEESGRTEAEILSHCRATDHTSEDAGSWIWCWGRHDKNHRTNPIDARPSLIAMHTRYNPVNNDNGAPANTLAFQFATAPNFRDFV